MTDEDAAVEAFRARSAVADVFWLVYEHRRCTKQQRDPDPRMDGEPPPAQRLPVIHQQLRDRGAAELIVLLEQETRAQDAYHAALNRGDPSDRLASRVAIREVRTVEATKRFRLPPIHYRLFEGPDLDHLVLVEEFDSAFPLYGKLSDAAWGSLSDMLCSHDHRTPGAAIGVHVERGGHTAKVSATLSYEET